MDGLTFVSKIIEAFAWPLTALGIIWLVLKNLAAIKGSISSLKAQGLEINFREELQTIKESATDAGVTVMYRDIADKPDLAQSTGDPHTFIIRQWAEIEEMLIDWERNNPSQSVTRNPRTIIERLKSQGVIDNDLYGLLLKMQDLRSQVVHESGFELSRGDAIDFLSLTRSLKSRLSIRLGTNWSPTPAPAPPPPPVPRPPHTN